MINLIFICLFSKKHYIFERNWISVKNIEFHREILNFFECGTISFIDIVFYSVKLNFFEDNSIFLKIIVKNPIHNILPLLLWQGILGFGFGRSFLFLEHLGHRSLRHSYSGFWHRKSPLDYGNLARQ